MTKKRIISLMLTLAVAMGASAQISTVAFASTTTNNIATASSTAKAGCGVVFTDNGIKYTITNPSSDTVTVDYTIIAYGSNNNVLGTYTKTIELEGNDYITYTRKCVGAVKVGVSMITTDINGNTSSYSNTFIK